MKTLQVFARLIQVVFLLPQVAAQKIGVELVADGLASPIDLISAPGDDTSRYIVDQNGYIFLIWENNTVITDDPFLNISDVVEISSAFDERGLLGVAFSPDFDDNGLLYVTYSTARSLEENICYEFDGSIPTAADGCPYQHLRVVSEFAVVDGKVDRASERRLFSIEWPGRSRNGGGLAFGPEKYLYVGLGDGAFVAGPLGRGNEIVPAVQPLYFGELYAQDPTTYFGKILRIDVNPSGDTPYTIPSDNPFASNVEFPNYKGEIYAWGVRNPYRISFDYEDGNTFYMSASADTFFEATYKVPEPGNYGWAIREGSHCVVASSPFLPPEFVNCTSDEDCPQGPQSTTCGLDGYCTCPTEDSLGYPLINPFLEYINSGASNYQMMGKLGDPKGTASLSGHMYRGSEIPWLVGKFIQADFSATFLDGLIYIATENDDGSVTLDDGYMFNATNPAEKGFLKAIGRDGKGELYAITGDFTPDFSESLGRIWKIVDASEMTSPTASSPTPGPMVTESPTPSSTALPPDISVTAAPTATNSSTSGAEVNQHMHFITVVVGFLLPFMIV